MLEETGHPFEPSALLGVYQSDTRWQDGEAVRFLRFAFVGTVGPRQRDVLGNAGREQKGLLRHPGQVPAQRRQRIERVARWKAQRHPGAALPIAA